MGTLFSASTNSFWDTQCSGLPKDCKPVSEELRTAVLLAELGGRPISSDVDGMPINIDPLPLTVEQKSSIERYWRDGQLTICDNEIRKIEDGEKVEAGTVSDWRAYRSSLRAWPEAKKFPDENFRPKSPSAS